MAEDPIYQALEVLRRGGIILYPTDTVWGIGCDATNEQAVARIYDLKQSVNKKSMLVLLDQIDKVSLYILGIRIPDHEFCNKLIHKLNRPIVSTSANISGKPSPMSFSEIAKEIVDGVDLVIDRAWEGRPTGKASSIVKVGVNGEIEIIRP